jgi:glyoxylase-like metal-dependent hydrolase (beta-lactamase superfamily II)
MNTTNYHFSVGSIKCLAISDGSMTYSPPTFPPPAIFLFANADKEKLPRTLRDHGINMAEWTEWTSSYTCLLLDTGKYRVLVDTGAGGLGNNTGQLLPNLKLEGVSPEDIDIVILTHAHPDHIGGNINSEGKPVFSRAKWIIWKDEWLYWTTKQAESQQVNPSQEILVNIARANLLPLQGRIDLVDKESEIVPGIHSLGAPGHTPGLMALSIAHEGDRLLCISDAVIHPVHLAEPEWFGATDVFPDQVRTTRSKLLNTAALENSLVMAFHFPFPGLGHIIPKDRYWQWQPLKETAR